MAIVYKITNTVNGKIYIGYTSRTLEERWKEHIYRSKKSKCFFNTSIRKYGAAAFKPEVLVEDTDDLWCLNFAEPLLIEFFNSTDSNVGYNSTLGGGYITPSTVEIAAKLTAANKARWANPEYRAKLTAANKAYWANPENRAKQAATIKASWANPEYRDKLTAANKAYWANPEQRAKQIATIKASWANPEQKAKQAATIKASWANPEQKAKHSAIIKANWANPEQRAKRAAAIKARWANPEYRAKLTAAIKASWVIRKLLKISINESGLSPEIQGTSSRLDP